MNKADVLRSALICVAASPLLACGGGGSTPQTFAPTTPPVSIPTPTGNVTISGTVTFDRVPLNAVNGSGLDYNAIRQDPIRGAVAELVNSGGSVLSSTLTDDSGRYSFTVTANTQVKVRIKAQLLRTDGASDINLSVVDNTNNDALYVLEGSTTAAATQVRNLNAPSGWGVSSYTSTRAAAPFALLDTLYDTTQAFVAVDSDIDFPKLNIYWSPQNRSADGTVSDGEIGTSSYTRFSGQPTILILGDENNDTDEYDASVISHEFGHYFEDVFSRSDSIGGSHSQSNRLDMRVAFGEGWGNALSGFISGERYRDSFGTSQNRDFGISVENNTPSQLGWYSEGSVQSILFDIMDATSDGADTTSAGLGPVYRTFISDAYRNVVEVTSIFAFQEALRNSGEIPAAELDALLNAQNITGRGSDGAGETDDGGVTSALPVYSPLAIGGAAVEVCSVDDAGEYNKLGNRAFLTMTVPGSQTVTLTATSTDPNGTSDPEIRLFQRGAFLVNSIGGTNNTETTSRLLAPDDYVVVIFDDANSGGNSGGDFCYNVTAQ